MKKVFAVVASIAMFALSMTSCQKDESVLKFKATIERGDTKTSLNAVNADNEHPITWEAEDEIKVWGNSTTNGYYFVTQQSGNSVEFTTTESTGNLGNSTSFEAGYPADMWQTGIEYHLVNLPTERVYRENNIYKFPMYATSNNTSLEFKNVCGVLKIQLPQINKQINGIAIYASSAIAGEFSVSMRNGVPFLTEVAGADELEMQFDEPVDLNVSDGKYFYIYLPSSSDLGQTSGFTGFEMMFFATDGTYAVARANAGIVIERSKITTVDLGGIQFDQQVETSNNYFSVSPTLKVDLSQGNLQYVTTSGTWRFALHQYDFIGAKETNENNNVIDMFARSSSENDYGLMHGLDNNSNITITSINGDFRDWSALMSSDRTPWRTLSHSEWNYLFGLRDGYEHLRADVILDLTYEQANIVPFDADFYVWNDIKDFLVSGLILLPDGSTASFEDLEQPISTNDLNTFLTTNGAVFIPMVHGRMYGDVLSPAPHGIYWNSDMQYGTNHNTNVRHFGQTNSAFWQDWDLGGFFPFYGVEKIDETNPERFSYYSVRLARNAMRLNAEGHWEYTHTGFQTTPAKSRKK